MCGTLSLFVVSVRVAAVTCALSPLAINSPASAAVYGCLTSSESRNVAYVTDKVFETSAREATVANAFTPKFDFVGAFDWSTYCLPWEDVQSATTGFRALRDQIKAINPAVRFIEVAPPEL